MKRSYKEMSSAASSKENSADFEAVAQAMRDQRPSTDADQKKEIYGLFKQASVGDNSASCPGIMSGFEARGKWYAWDAKKGMEIDDAKQAYIDLCKPFLSDIECVKNP